MKLTATRLRQIIKEEVARSMRPQRLREGSRPYASMHTLGGLYELLKINGRGALRMMKNKCGGVGGIVVATDPDDMQGPVVLKQDPAFEDDVDMILDSLHTLLNYSQLPPSTPVLYGSDADTDISPYGDDDEEAAAEGGMSKEWDINDLRAHIARERERVARLKSGL